MTSLRTRTWPSTRSTCALSTSSKSSWVGQPTGRLLSWTSRGLVIGSPWESGDFVMVRGSRRVRGSVDDDLDGDVAARGVGVGAHLVCGVDELAAELRVDALRQLDVQDDAETEAGARGPGEADVGGDRDVEVLDPALAGDEPESAGEARGIPGGEELLRVGALPAAAELLRGGKRDVEAAVGGDGATLTPGGGGRGDVLGGLGGGAHQAPQIAGN